MAFQAQQSYAAEILKAQPKLRAELSNSDSFQAHKNGLKTVEIEGETKYYVVEGDLLLDEDQLLIYVRQQESLQKMREAERNMNAAGFGVLGLSNLEGLVNQRHLVGIERNGKIVRWKEGLILTYCVLKPTFSNTQRYETVREHMRQATQAWEKTCGVKFQHQEELDNSGDINPISIGVLFTVREINAGGEFIAAAFFPDDPPMRRRVLIDPSYFEDDLGFDKIGVLRHELGHVLGFRHEHIRSGAPAVCPDEPRAGTIDLTQYDPQSVMHYFCGGVGSASLAITELDKTGSQQVYGPPLDLFAFAE